MLNSQSARTKGMLHCESNSTFNCFLTYSHEEAPDEGPLLKVLVTYVPASQSVTVSICLHF